MDIYEKEGFSGSMRCAVCQRTLIKEEVKFLVASAELQEISLPIDKRYLCTRCYSGMNTGSVRYGTGYQKRKELLN